MENNKHYACKGTCGGVADTPGTCSAQGCTNQGKSLEECDCGNPEAHKKDAE